MRKPRRLYLDEDVSELIAEPLRRMGHDVLTTREAENKGLKDPEQVQFAIAQNRIIVTNNRYEFQRDLHPVKNHTGIIAGTHDTHDGHQRFARNVHTVLAENPDLSNTLVRADKLSYSLLDKGGDVLTMKYGEGGRQPIDEPEIPEYIKKEAQTHIDRIRKNSRETVIVGDDSSGMPPQKPSSRQK